ncbi:hypothetical protein GF319_07550 [Candidatus Bathyarchaeota archaeon]|nr:hypothetical protein [Candidatus Bathyarchaeota archaeon]
MKKLSSKSAIITYKKGYYDTGFSDDTQRTSGHISRNKISQEIRDAMRPRFKWRPSMDFTRWRTAG